MTEAILIHLMILIALIWHSAMKARERALGVARGACARMELELLDDTVTMSTMRISRNDQGQLGILRIYTFRYTEDDPDPREGVISFHGRHVEMVALTPDLANPQ